MIAQLLKDNNIDKQVVNDLLTNLSGKNVDYADLYFQHSVAESWILEDGIIKDGAYYIQHGVGIRSITGEKVGFSYSDELNLNALNSAILFVKESCNTSGKGNIKVANNINNPQNVYSSNNPLNSLSSTQKITILKDIDNLARKNKLVQKVSASLSGAYTEILIATTDGCYKFDYRPMVMINVSVVVEKNGRVEKASNGGGGRYDYNYFLENNLPESYTKESLRQAMVALESKPSPAGLMPVVLASCWPGVLLHEAVGHGLEGDFNRKKTSVFSDKMGKQVASSICTIVDNGTINNRRGSLNIDDEGVASQRTVLIEKGILKQYLFDKHNARLMNKVSTGNGRRESYAHLPMPRMTNTYMEAGDAKLEDMIASVDFGIYAVNFDGGQVDVTSGEFVFSANEAYLIKNGKIQHPIKGATIIGSGHKVLQNISMVGDDFGLDSGIGICGKEGQSIPVGVGQPSLKVDKLTVGGVEV